MFKQDSLENISKMLYGNKYNKKEENNNSFLNQSKDNNINNYKIKPIKDSTPQELLYGVKKQEDKNKEDKETNPTNIKPIKDLTPQELLYGVKDKGKERKNSTPIEKIKKVDVRDMYDKNIKLEEKQTEINLNNKIKNIKESKLLTSQLQKQIGKNYNDLRHNIAKSLVGKDAAGMLDLAHGDKILDKNYIKEVIDIKNFNDPIVASDKEYLREKISKQFNDYNFDINKIKGYYFKNNSEASKRISNDESFKKIIKDNKNKILNNEEFSGTFNKKGPIGIFDNNLKNAIGSFDARNIQFDKEGNLHIKIYDTYDFNKKAQDFLNKAGRHELESGNLKPYFSIHDIIIPKDKLDNIWK